MKSDLDIAFRPELEQLEARFPNLHVTVTLTRGGSGEWKGERGRITPEMLKRAVPNIASRRVHICGPTEMTDPTRRMLVGLGVPETAIHYEAFTSPSRKASTSGEVPESPAGEPVDAEVTFARSGKSASVPARKTLLEAAEDLGITMNYDCRAGICGQCKTRILSGSVTMESDRALTPADRANGLILSCQARCLEDVVLEA